MTDSPLSQSMIDFGVGYTRAEAGPGQGYWQLIHAEGPEYIGGNHTIYVDIQDEHGQRMLGVRVQCFNGGNFFKASEPKPGEQAALDFPIFAANHAYGVRVADGEPSDAVVGMGLVPFEQHVSYLLIFRHAVMGGAPVEPPPIIVPPPSMSAKEAIEQAKKLLDYALGVLP